MTRLRMGAGAALALVAGASGVAASAAQPSPDRPPAPPSASADASGPAGASGPTVTTDHACYLQQRQIKLTASSFAPGDRYTVAVDRRQLGSGTVAPNGRLTGTFSSGRLFGRSPHQGHNLSVTAGSTKASTNYQVTRFTADFAPSAGNPRTLLVRFSAYAFGLDARRPETLYVHYLAPGGHLRDSVALGHTHGACGSLPRTRLHRLFPFLAQTGRWRLQFDTNHRYSPASRPRLIRTLVVGG